MTTSIGPYQISRELGRGGMGVVYLATDTRLDRQVAIKALPAELASDPARLERFEREAKTLASLNHPSLAGIHGVEEQGGAKYLVLEYVEGETLADRLDRGPLPVDEAVELAVQIAAGIEAAHEAGVIHRDLKPANIIVTPEGQAKVLDFGLARTDEQTTSAVSLDSPTMTTPSPQHSPTIEGAILGTAAYMSPEQARGRRVDKRTDIWSFGVVLYEMLIGASPFQGETASDSIGAVLHKSFDLDQLPLQTPPNVRRVLRRCLVRDKSMRIRSIGDVRIDLLDDEEVSRDTGDGTASHSLLVRALIPVALIVVLGCVALGIALLAGQNEESTTESPPSVVKIERVMSAAQIGSDASVSPDGRVVLYSAPDGTDSDIFALRIGGENPINLTPDSAADDGNPTWSPGGERIAFGSRREGGGIFVMGATGENPRRFADDGFNPAWSPDGSKLVYSTEGVVGPYNRSSRALLKIVDMETREVSELGITVPSHEESGQGVDAVQPAWSPDGRWIAFWGVDGGIRNLYLTPAPGGERIAITQDEATNWNPVWGPNSDKLYFLSDRLGVSGVWQIQIDPESGRPIGDPVAVLPGPANIWTMAIDGDGSQMIAISSVVDITLERQGFDPAEQQFVGSPTLIQRSPTGVRFPSISPDGEWIVYNSGSPEENIVLMRSDGTAQRRLTSDSYRNRSPTWNPGDGGIVWSSNRGGQYELWRMDRDGTGVRRIGAIEGRSLTGAAFNPDGRVLSANASVAGGTQCVIFDVMPSGDLELRDQTVDQFYAREWSPDGERLAGSLYTDTGEWTSAIYDVEAEELVTLRSEKTGEPVGGISYHPWLDNDRTIMFDSKRNRILIGDVRTGIAKAIDREFEQFAMMFPFPGAREMLMVRATSSATIWAIELQDETP